MCCSASETRFFGRNRIEAHIHIRTLNAILYCHKWKETVAFYADVLQLDVHFSNDRFVEFQVGAGVRISVANQARATIKSAGGKGITLAFQIDDVPAMHTLLTESGADPTPIQLRWGSQVFYCHDPEGYRIEFWT